MECSKCLKIESALEQGKTELAEKLIQDYLIRFKFYYDKEADTANHFYICPECFSCFKIVYHGDDTTEVSRHTDLSEEEIKGLAHSFYLFGVLKKIKDKNEEERRVPLFFFADDYYQTSNFFLESLNFVDETDSTDEEDDEKTVDPSSEETDSLDVVIGEDENTEDSETDSGEADYLDLSSDSSGLELLKKYGLNSRITKRKCPDLYISLDEIIRHLPQDSTFIERSVFLSINLNAEDIRYDVDYSKFPKVDFKLTTDKFIDPKDIEVIDFDNGFVSSLEDLNIAEYLNVRDETFGNKMLATKIAYAENNIDYRLDVGYENNEKTFRDFLYSKYNVKETTDTTSSVNEKTE